MAKKRKREKAFNHYRTILRRYPFFLYLGSVGRKFSFCFPPKDILNRTSTLPKARNERLALRVSEEDETDGGSGVDKHDSGVDKHDSGVSSQESIDSGERNAYFHFLDALSDYIFLSE